MIPFLDLHRQYLSIKSEIGPAMEAVIEQTAFAGGPFVEKFENNFAKYCGTKYSIGLNSGTSALHLAMEVLGIGPGDEVILPANTFVATAWGISYVGAIPIFVDCDEYYNIDTELVKDYITSKTKAIIGVHLYGQPCDIDSLLEICKVNSIYFVEDAAQAHGAMYKGSRVGGFGEMACFSFYPGKNLGAYGEGGGITTSNEQYRDKLFSLRSHGSKIRYYHDEIGYNMRMDGIQGAILDVKLKYLEEWNNNRNQIANRYLNEIQNKAVNLPKIRQDVKSAYHLFVVTVDNRDHFMKYLSDNGVSSAQHYPVPCHLQKAYAFLGYKEGDFPKSEYLAAHCVSLPMFAELTDVEVNKIIEVVNAYVA